MPLVPPPWFVAEKVFDTVMLAFRAFESELRKASRMHARHRREQNPNLIFQDIKMHASKGVDVLTRAATAEVIELREEEQAVVLSRAVDFDLTKPIFCNGPVIQHPC